MSDSQSTANAGNITKFKISANMSDRSRELTNAIGEFRYYESVLSNNITASAAIVETGFEEDGGQETFARGTLDWLPIRGGERVDIVVEDAQPEPNRLDFSRGMDALYVNRVRGVDPGTQKDVYFMDFASKEYFSNDMMRVTRKYEEKISDNVKDIVEQLLEGTWADGEGVDGKDIDETSLSYNFIGCDKKPFYVCTWLASKAVPTGSSDIEIGAAAGYFFWQTRDGFHFRSIDKIFDEGKQNRDSLKKFIYNNTGEAVDGYDANIVNYDIESNIDLNEKLMLGSYNNRSIFFDSYAFNYKVVDYNISEQQGKVSTAGDDFVNVAEEFTRSPSRVMAHIMDYGVLPRGVDSQAQLQEWKDEPEQPNYDAEKTMVQTIMRYNQLFTVKTTIIIPGDFSIKAGDTVVCDFPELDGDPNKTVNDQSGGIYMVAEVCHRLTPKECFTSMTLIRDSFGRSTGSSSSGAGAAVNNDVLFF